jgi:hypothetical protein
MTTPRSQLLRVATLFVLGVGCGGGGGKATTVSDYCDQRATKECTSNILTKCVTTQDACEADRHAACMAEAAALMSSTRTFQTSKIGACVNKAAEVYNKSTVTPTDRQALAEACGRVFSGTKKEDEPCQNGDSFECEQGLICDQGFNLCSKRKNVSADANCNNPGETCPDSQYCLAIAPNPVRSCNPRKGTGETCDAQNPCAATLRCNAGTCADRIDLGMACTADSDCSADGPYCDTFNGSICTAGFSPGTGQAECREFGSNVGGGTGGASGGGTGGAGGA